MIELQASEKEPGYFIRLVLSLSILTKTPVKIDNIREKEEQKGLTKSDVMYIKLFSQMSNAKLKNVDKGKTSFTFEPSEEHPNCQTLVINLSFPALVPLFLPYLMFIYQNKNCKVRINGPTNREKKITIDYIKDVICPLLNEINVKQRIDITKRGYYQDSGSIILNTKETKEILPLELLKQGEIDRIRAIVHSYGYNDAINEYMLDGAQKRLKLENIKISAIENTHVENREKYKGYGIDLFAIHGNIVLGANYTSIKKQASQVGKEAADRLISTIARKLPLDKHASNIIIPFLCFAKGKSKLLVNKNDDFIAIGTDICTKMLGTEFKMTDVDEDKMILEIIPKTNK